MSFYDKNASTSTPVDPQLPGPNRLPDNTPNKDYTRMPGEATDRGNKTKLAPNDTPTIV